MNHTMLTRPNPIREGFFLSDRQGRDIHPHSRNQPPLCQRNHTHTQLTNVLTNYTSTIPDRHINSCSCKNTPKATSSHVRTHTHTHNLTDSNTTLIADLNGPGNLSLSLTHTQHTSFFPHLFPPLSLLPLSFHFFAQMSFSPSVTPHYFIFCPPSPPLLYLPDVIWPHSHPIMQVTTYSMLHVYSHFADDLYHI